MPVLMRADEKNNFFPLDDKIIRKALLARLARASNAPRAILEEVRVHNGNAIADVVAVHNYAHCYEIKSDKDTLERAQMQARFYDLVFRKVTLVTTSRHLQRAIQLMPSHWGILLARRDNEEIVMTYVRRSTLNKTFDKELALLTLWRSELATLAGSLVEAKLDKLNRKKLSSLIAERLGVSALSHHIGLQLTTRRARR